MNVEHYLITIAVVVSGIALYASTRFAFNQVSSSLKQALQVADHLVHIISYAERHDERVTELLEANNAMLERVRTAERTSEELRKMVLELSAEIEERIDESQLLETELRETKTVLAAEEKDLDNYASKLRESDRAVRFLSENVTEPLTGDVGRFVADAQLRDTLTNRATT